MTAELFIARHGQNEDNVRGILNGHRDLPLTELGRRQARQLGEGIKERGMTFDVIYSSPLSRAYETAEIVAGMLGMSEKPVAMPLLIERDFGVMTGQPIAKIETMCAPDIIKTDTITYFLNPEGAETFPDLLVRGTQALEEIRHQQATGNALIVCHGDIGKMVYASATGKQWRQVLTDFHFGNCELIDVKPDGKVHVIKLEQYNL